MVAVAKVDGQGVHGQEDDQQDNDARGGKGLEVMARIGGPVVYLNGEYAEPVEGRSGKEGEEHQGADGYHGGSLADGTGHGEDDACEDAGDAFGDDNTLYDLPLRGPQSVGGVAMALRNGANGFAGGEDDYGKDEKGEGEAASEEASTHAEHLHEQAETQKAVDDGGHASEVGDVDLNEAGEAILGGVFLEVKGCAYSYGYGECSDETHDVDGANDSMDEARFFGMAGGIVGEELPTEPRDALPEDLDQQGYQADQPDADGSEEV